MSFLEPLIEPLSAADTPLASDPSAPQLLRHLRSRIYDFANSLDIEDTLNATLATLMRDLRTEAAAVFLFNQQQSELVCHGCAGPLDLRGIHVPLGEGIIGQSLAQRRIQIVRDIRQTPAFYMPMNLDTKGYSPRSLLCAPLLVQDQALGAIELFNKLPSPGNPEGFFDDLDAQLLDILAAAAALAIRNATMAHDLVRSETLRRELQLARGIQERFLPPFNPADPIVGLNQAAKNVSGDFYDYQRLSDGRYAFNLGDVSGKGMDAAILMARAHSLYHCLAKTQHSPAAILRTLNEELCEHAMGGLFVTMIGGLYDPQSGTIVLANAGHLPALCRARDGTFTRYGASALPLGILSGLDIEEQRFTLAQGSLYLYTDGLSEGLARVRQPDGTVSNMANDDRDSGMDSLEQLIDRLAPLPREQRLRQLAQEASQLDYSFDDLTVLLVEKPQA
ncbi:MAG: SpoIIE family protein phosphatase [Pseudomonadales bacterium]|jgi:sigma-B regulation protein RsbU (phosphoserine phosphatase)|nr:SpoIIE family protein phosphatase [Pseudomonadales bacterium]